MVQLLRHFPGFVQANAGNDTIYATYVPALPLVVA